MVELTTNLLDAVLVDRPNILVYLSAGTADASGLRCRLTVLVVPPGDLQLSDFFDTSPESDPLTRGTIWASNEAGALEVEVIGGYALAGEGSMKREVDFRLDWPDSFPFALGIDWPTAGVQASIALDEGFAPLRAKVQEQRPIFQRDSAADLEF